MFCFLSVARAHGSSCIHDQIMKNVVMEYGDIYPKRKANSGAEWNNIRVKFDFGFIDRKKPDENMCVQVGQEVINQNDNIRCSEDDILTEQKIKGLKATFENVANYMNKLLKVIPVEKPFKDGDDLISDTDLFISVFSRPFGRSSVMAYASATAIDTEYRRPYKGSVTVNPAYVPTRAISINDYESAMFYAYFHEITHALGFSSYFYRFFHPYEISKPYNTTQCSITKLGKQFTFLVTPFCHIWAQKHYGVDTFYGDDGESCPSGIEIEDGGGTGTAKSHLEGRVFNSDYMVGLDISNGNPYVRITDATAAVMQDTGNYKFNYEMLQPLVWGHPESIDGNYIEDFATGSPAKVFPKEYTKFNTNGSMTGFTFKYVGLYSSIGRVDCSRAFDEATKFFCSKEKFYDPNHQGISSNLEVYDYIPLKMPWRSCKDENTAIIETTDNSEAACGNYVCADDFKSFTWNYSGYSIYCNKTNYLNRTGRYWCPEPERFCRTVHLQKGYFKADPFDLDTQFYSSLYGPALNRKDPNWLKRLIVGCIIAGIVFIVIVVYAVFIIIQKNSLCSPKDDNADNDEPAHHNA